MTNNDHISVIQKKVFGALNTVHPLKLILPREIKLQLFKTLILPIFDYMDIIYHDYGIHGTNNLSDRLEKLQNIAIRFISNVKRREHITAYRKELNLLKLFDRRTLHVACQINKMINNNAPQYLQSIIKINRNNTRSNNKLIVNMPKNNFQKSSFNIGAPIVWNRLPNEIRTIKESDNFKKEINDYYFNEIL